MIWRALSEMSHVCDCDGRLFAPGSPMPPGRRVPDYRFPPERRGESRPVAARAKPIFYS